MSDTYTRVSLTDLVRDHNITADAQYGNAPIPEDFNPDGISWHMTLSFGRRLMAIDYFTGPNRDDVSAADVLDSMLSDTRGLEGQSFESWCSDYGYSTDSRRAERVFMACQAELPKLRRFLGKHFEAFMESEGL